MLNLFINSLLVTLLLWESPAEKTVHEKRQQALVYDIIRGKEKIGTVVAVRIINGETSASRIETHSELRMVFTIKVDIVARNTFKNHVLTESHVKKEVNGAVRTNNSVFLDDSGYCLVNKESDTTVYNGSISSSVSDLYFEEPVGLDRIFSEMFLQHIPLKKVAPAEYQLSMPDGNTNSYTYKDGICSEAIVETELTTVKLKLISSLEE